MNTTETDRPSSRVMVCIVGLALSLASPAYASSPARSAAEGRPNIVFVIGDDHGYPYAGFMGSEVVKTPHLDDLASAGTVFTTAYNTSSICRPSLRSLLTGLEPLQWDLRAKQIRQRGLAKKNTPEIRSFRTLPSLLSLRGYRSFQAGKHWEGTSRDAGFSEGTARKRKANDATLIAASGGSEGLEIGRTTMKPVLDFLAAGKEPFLLWFAPALPHAPMDASDAYVQSRYGGQGLSRSAELYYANVSRLDDSIGQLVAELERLELRSRTLVVYVSDNGWKNGPHEEVPPSYTWNTGPGGKGSMRELGFRTPIIFNWPGQIPGGKVRDDLVSTLDLFPTLLDYAGLETPRGRPGRSLRPGIEGERDVSRSAIVGHKILKPSLLPGNEDAPQDAYFVRTKALHYIWYPHSGLEEVFDLSVDPEELRNIAGNGFDSKWFRSQISIWRKRARASLPQKGARSDAWRPFR